MSKQAEKIEYVVYTANPDLIPLAVYEIERGVFNTESEAVTLAKEIMQQERKDVQIKRRFVNITIEVDYCWYNATHFTKD